MNVVPFLCIFFLSFSFLLDSQTCNSAGASPVGPSKHEIFQDTSSTTCSSKLLTYHNAVRTSRSDDQLQVSLFMLKKGQSSKSGHRTVFNLLFLFFRRIVPFQRLILILMKMSLHLLILY